MKLKALGIYLSDAISKWLGSWTFLIIQSTILLIWVVLNYEKITTFDPYPFVFLNLVLSFQAAYATPLLLMSSNRTAERDRQIFTQDLEVDHQTNVHLELIIKQMGQLRKDIKRLEKKMSSL